MHTQCPAEPAVNAAVATSFSPSTVCLVPLALPGDSNPSHSVQTRRLKRHTFQPYHILRSIAADAAFVHSVADTLQLPLVVNLRCGRWYADPSKVADLAYFKSTDGHYGQWQVPTRRLNLHLLPLIETHGGLVLVDSTRRGKRFPDALSRTVPLWCAAMNTLLFPGSSAAPVVTLPSLVSASETSAMSAHLEHTILPRLRAARLHLPTVTKPLRPIWLGQHSVSIERVDPDELDYWPVYCLSASRVVDNAAAHREHGFVYIQGAADDEENWSLGLTPEMFWTNAKQLLASAEACDSFLASLRHQQSIPWSQPIHDWVVCRIPDTPLFIAASSDAAHPSTNPWSTFTHIINCTNVEHMPLETYLDPIQPASLRPKRYVCMRIPDGKRGQMALGLALAQVDAWYGANVTSESKVLVHCNHTRDRSVAVVLLLLIRFHMHVVRLGEPMVPAQAIDKEEIRRVLVWLTHHYPRALPSRASLKQLNRYLIPAPSGMDSQTLS